MTTLVFVPGPGAAPRMAAWFSLLSPNVEDVEFICYGPEGDRQTEDTLREALSELRFESPQVSTIASPTPVAELLELVRKNKPRQLITASFSFDSINGTPQTTEHLIRSAPCMTLAPLFGSSSPNEVRKILLIVSQGAHDATALRVANTLRTGLHAKVTLGTVEEDTGSKAARAGKRAIYSLIHDSGLERDDFEIKVVVDRLRPRGIRSCVEDHDLIICGADSAKDLRPLRQSLQSKMAMVVKRAPPLRLRSLAEWIPRINPRDHADLLQDLRQGSRWNSDFILMLALAAAIASLGLMQNSPAVVIGSMLLAPLMTPMIGAGLALAQANVSLAKQCTKSIALGLLLTLVVSYMLGIVTPSRETLSPEVLSRGSPNILDLLIALFAAIAATVAMARPNIAGAIAGVAIATALVPPICAVGLSLSLTEYGNALGAFILFGTNLVAIIVASSFTFSLLGIMTVRSLPKHRRRIGSIRWGLVVLLVILAGPLSISLIDQLNQGRSQTALYPVTRRVSRALRAHVEKGPGVHITFLGRSSVTDAVIIHLAADHALPKSYGEELKKITREKMGDPDLPVYLVCLHSQWMVKSAEQNP